MIQAVLNLDPPITIHVCHQRKYADENTVKRVLWAARLNGRLYDCRPAYCRLCRAWHVRRDA